jgi:phage-related protein
MTAPGGSIGSVHGTIRIEYDNRGVARARDDMGRFVSLAGLFSNDIDNATKRGTRGFNLMSVSIGKVLKVLTLSALAASALHTSLVAVVGITQALIPVVNAGLGLMPGLLLAAVSAAAVLKLALLGVGDALKAAASGDAEKLAEALEKLAPSAQQAVKAFAALRDTGKQVQLAIQDAFFAGTGPLVTNLLNSLFTLRTDAAGVATGFNGILTELLKLGTTQQTLAGIRGALGFVRDILGSIRSGVREVLEGFFALAGQIGIFGKDAGSAFNNLLTRFGQFLQGLNLAELIQAAEPILRSIITLFTNLGSIVNTVFTSMSLGGGNLFGVLGEITSKLAEFLNTDVGRGALGALGDVFRTISSTVGPLLLALLQALAPAIAALAPLVISLANAVGASLGAAITTLAPVLLTLVPALVSGLLPVLPQLSAAFLELAPVIGQVVQLFADHLANILPLILPLLTQLATVLADVLVQALNALLPAMQELLPAFAQFGEDILPSLLPLIVSLGQLLVSLLPVFTTLANFLVAVVVPVFPLIADGVTILANALNWLVGVVTTVVQAIVAAFQWLFNILVGNSIIPELVSSIMGWFGRLSGFISGIMATIRGIIQAAVNAWVAAFQALGALPGMVAGFIGRVADAIRNGINTALGVIRSFPGQAAAALGGLGGILFSAGQNIIEGLINGIRSMAGAVRSAVSGVLSSARALLPFSPAKEGPFSGRGWTKFSGRALMEGLAEGVIAGRQAVVDAMSGVVGGLASTVNVDVSTGLSGASTGSSGGATVTGAALTVNQTVNALPGMDAQQVGDYALRRLAFGVVTGTSSVVQAVGGAA